MPRSSTSSNGSTALSGMLRINLDTSIFGVLSVSCIFRRIQCEITADLIPLPYLKTFIRKISCYDKGHCAYPHRNLPAGNNHLPFENEPQGVNDRYGEKNCADQ
jgi:hypothetical protein